MRRTSIWFVRHGQTQLNKERRYQSWSDSPMTDYGQQQAAAVALRLRRIPFDVILVSPVKRTRTTATMITDTRSSAPEPQEAPAWAELHHGRWEGLTYREVVERFPEESHQRFAHGAHGKAMGGESLAEVAARVLPAWETFTHIYPGGRVLVVTHATPIQLVLCAVVGMPITAHWHWRVDLGSITAFDVYPTGTIIRMVNEVSRLAQLEQQTGDRTV